MAIINGKIPLQQLTKIDSVHYLAPGCATAWKKFATELGLTVGNAVDSCYRTYEWQVYRYNLHLRYPQTYPVAAYPGTSNHGLGMAIDIGNYYRFSHAKLVSVGKKYGFVFDTSSEPWHIKYLGKPNYKTLTTAGSNSGLLIEENNMYLLLNTTTKERAIFAPPGALKLITQTESGVYGAILKNFRGLSSSVEQSVVTENVTDAQWKQLVKDFGIGE